MLRDNFGRRIDYLRLSVTDSCNLRCRYCRPSDEADGLAPAADSSGRQPLSCGELLHLAELFVKLGISRIKVTGGEPLLWPDLGELLRGLTKLSVSVTLTTNGVLLADRAAEIAALGLSGVNVSLDTTNRAVFASLCGRDVLPEVKAGLAALQAAGQANIKLNCVALRGINDAALPELAEFAAALRLPLRFIELMPIGAGRQYAGLSGSEVLAKLTSCFGAAERLNQQLGNGPAVYYRLANGQVIGLIEALHGKFCRSCNRVRLTADGFLKLCLQYPDGISLGGLLRRGYDDEYIQQAIREAVSHKPREHHFGAADSADSRRMFQIGG